MSKRLRENNGTFEEYDEAGMAMSTAGCVNPYPAVRLRGLPFNVTKEDVIDFAGVIPIDIVFQERGGRPNGTAFVLCANNDDCQVIRSKDKQMLGTRYVEIFPCMRGEFHKAVAESVQDQTRVMPFERGGRGMGFRGGFHQVMAPPVMDRPPRPMPAPIPLDPVTNPRGIEAVVKLRGLPFEATPRDITDWLNDAIRNREAILSQEVSAEDVVVATKNGSSIGIAFVEFKRYQDAERSLSLDRKYFGQRYVEVTMSTLEEQLRYTGAV